MPFLSYNNPRNRVTLIAALLLMEFMAILWLRESKPEGERGANRGSIFNSGSSHDRRPIRDNIHHQQQRQHLQHEHRREDSYREKKVQDPKADLRARGGRGQGVKSTEGKIYIKDQHHHHHHHHQHREGITQPAGTTTKTDLRQESKGNPDAIKKIDSASNDKAATFSAAASIPKLSSKDNKPSKPGRKSKPVNKKSSTKKAQQNHARTKNQRGGFKSTAERKLAQLIPALDENGFIIEDHFISPRDSDGDGIPDFYVLLRPTANSKYMMDVGLFDDEIVAPAPAVLLSVIATAVKPNVGGSTAALVPTLSATTAAAAVPTSTAANLIITPAISSSASVASTLSS